MTSSYVSSLRLTISCTYLKRVSTITTGLFSPAESDLAYAVMKMDAYSPISREVSTKPERIKAGQVKLHQPSISVLCLS